MNRLHVIPHTLPFKMLLLHIVIAPPESNIKISAIDVNSDIPPKCFDLLFISWISRKFTSWQETSIFSAKRLHPVFCGKLYDLFSACAAKSSIGFWVLNVQSQHQPRISHVTEVGLYAELALSASVVTPYQQLGDEDRISRFMRCGCHTVEGPCSD